MLDDDRAAWSARLKRRREETVQKSVSVKMQIKEDPLSFAAPVALRHRVERKPPKGKPYVDYLGQHRYHVGEVFKVCLAFRLGGEGQRRMDRWPLPHELCGLIERAPGSMPWRTAARLFDQTMEEARHAGILDRSHFTNASDDFDEHFEDLNDHFDDPLGGFDDLLGGGFGEFDELGDPGVEAE